MRPARVLLVALLAALTVGCGGGGERPRPVPVAGSKGNTVDAGGFSLYFECAGRGAPTVVLEAGLGSDTHAWDEVYEPVSRLTRVCRYDRAGVGRSESGPTPRSSATTASELWTLLDNARIDGPYVLVGHSYGGMHLRVFAAEHRDEVAGAVFVDSSHPDDRAAGRRALGPPRAGEHAAVTRLRQVVTDVPPADETPEEVDFLRTEREVRRAGSLGDVPVVVLTAGELDVAEAAAGMPVPRPVVRALFAARLRVQARLRALASNSLHAVAPHSGHGIQSASGQPDLVVRSIRLVVRAARSGWALPECRRAFRKLAARCVGST